MQHSTIPRVRLRQSSFERPTEYDSDIRGTPRAMQTLNLFDNYRLLPCNWMHALIENRGAYEGAYVKLCKRLYWHGLLDRRTFDGMKKKGETLTYWRTPAGDRFVHDKGFAGLPHDGTHDAHQLLTDLSDAQIDLGLRGTDVQLHRWPAIKDHPATPPLPKKPFRFEHPTGWLVPDGRPFYLKRGDNSILFLKELDRDNESRSIIRDKLVRYKDLETAIKTRFNFDSVMLLVITTNLRRQMEILELTKEVFGRSRWILTNLIDDHVHQVRSTAPVVTDLIDRPWLRVGAPPFSLKTLSDVQ